jgi:ubiquitin-activating enzyme E1
MNIVFGISNIIDFHNNINLEQIKTILKQENLNLNIDSINKYQLINDFKNEIIDKRDKNINNIQIKINSINPVIFEKDNNLNNHVNFLLSLSNLRAKNYKINKCVFLKTKEIAGNIIPAVSSTTASITGLCVNKFIFSYKLIV